MANEFQVNRVYGAVVTVANWDRCQDANWGHKSLGFGVRGSGSRVGVSVNCELQTRNSEPRTVKSLLKNRVGQIVPVVRQAREMFSENVADLGDPHDDCFCK